MKKSYNCNINRDFIPDYLNVLKLEVKHYDKSGI